VTHWIRVSSEVNIPGRLGAEERKALSAVFSNKPGSPWELAVRRLGLPLPREEVLRFVDGVPFFNATAFARTVQPGWWRAFRAQWRLEKFVAALSIELPLGEAAIRESVALGLVVQLISLRLPAAGERARAGWLMDPATAPPTARATIRKLLALQGRRARLSPAWGSLFSSAAHEPIPDSFPVEFHDEPPLDRAVHEVATPVTLDPVTFTGIPIAPGRVEGVLGLSVLAFAQARPTSVEEFGIASAVAFAEGGAFAHACCIARERGLPCVSGLGKAFWRSAEEWRRQGHTVEVTLDGAAGTLLCRPRAVAPAFPTR
jgi:phosphohistidine swiveling domain-containing protein